MSAGILFDPPIRCSASAEVCPQRWRSWFAPGRFGMLASILACFLVLFQVFRLLMYWSNHHLAGDAELDLLLGAFVVGFRFDLAMAAYLTLPLWLICCLLQAFRRGDHAARAVWWTCLAITCVLAVIGVAEIEFYREFFTRYNSLAIAYWSQPQTVLSMLWHGFPVLRYLLLAGLLAACFMKAVYHVVRYWSNREVAASRLGWRDAAAYLVGCLLLVIGARGGLRGSPLEWGDAVHCDATFANHLAHNGPWLLAKALCEHARKSHAALTWPHPLTAKDADTRASELLQPAAVGQRPFVPSAKDAPNVVVIIMESFSARFVGAVGSDDDFTPCFNQLSQHGILFDRCFSAGTHTHQANVAVLAGFPNLPRHETLMEDFTLGTQPLPALPRALKERGYQTMYLYNGDFAWENMRGFFKLQGIDRFIGREDFDRRAYSDATWGVSDKDLFDRANQEFKAATAPFFAAILTLSNHAPFQLPRPLPFSEITSEGSMNSRMNGIRYADWALGQFFEQARNEAYFKNTLFVLVGDHGFSVAPILTELRLLRFHVPLLFYAPELMVAPPRRIDAVASQSDIIPTILGVLGVDSRQHWGRDLFRLPNDDPGFAFFKPSESSDEMGYARGNRLLVRSADGQFHAYRYDFGFPPKAEKADLKSPEFEQMQRDMQAYVASAGSALLTRRASDARPRP